MGENFDQSSAIRRSPRLIRSFPKASETIEQAHSRLVDSLRVALKSSKRGGMSQLTITRSRRLLSAALLPRPLFSFGAISPLSRLAAYERKRRSRMHPVSLRITAAALQITRSAAVFPF